jgi:Ca-activated chloride channel family protein
MKPSDQNPAPQDPKQGQQHKDATAGQQQNQEKPGQPSAGAQMLNRLKDQPGRALMPRYEQRQTDKDW